ncbi:hypothetical protein C8R45DRAFT_835672, partial [Mycena sanguinolenta]
LSLHVTVCDKPENVYVSILPGPSSPHKHELNPYLRPIIDVAVVGWNLGIHFSSTGTQPDTGRIVDIAFILSANDLPAARALAGAAGHGAHIYCTCCTCRGRSTLYRTDFEKWERRDKDEDRRHAEEWRDANTQKERDDLYQKNGVRWSEICRLPYWCPSLMLVVDPMHCNLEGLVHHHCRRLLKLNLADATKKVRSAAASAYDFAPLDTVVEGLKLNERQAKSVEAIYRHLVYQLAGGVAGGRRRRRIHSRTLHKKLKAQHKPSLKWVCSTLEIPAIVPSVMPPHELAKLLMDWRLKKPSRDTTGNPIPSKPIDETSLRFVQNVIANRTTPAWVNHVPKNYGEKGVGSMKADEWRLLATIYLPIALVLLWGEQSGLKADLLMHSMALFQATTILCRFISTRERASAYRDYIKTWVENLYRLFPHTKVGKKRTNIHMAFHVYDFLLLFGPVLSWWCFPLERLIGILQQFNSNGHIGGEQEATIVKTWLRGANLRRWLNHKDCPELIRQFHRLYSIHVANKTEPRNPETKPSSGTERAHFNSEGMHFSRASTHLGNSLVSFNLDGSTAFGSIEKIITTAESAQFVVRPQEALPLRVNDPFKRFIHFPARLCSAKMASSTVIVEPKQVIGHYARYIWGKFAVVLELSRVCILIPLVRCY